MNVLQKIFFLGENSVYDNFYDETSVNNHDTQANNNSSGVCISQNVNDVESTIRHDGITIHPNSNFDKIAHANITAINEERETNSISKVTIPNDRIEECKTFLERAKKFNSIIEKRKHESEVT